MTDEELRKDAKYAHAVFDLCGIRSTTRGSQPASLRLRALMLGCVCKRIFQGAEVPDKSWAI